MAEAPSHPAMLGPTPTQVNAQALLQEVQACLPQAGGGEGFLSYVC